MSRQHLEQDYYLLEALHNCENAGRMPRAKLRLYFDMRSGFTYLAYVVTRRSSVFTECDISYVPADMYALWKTCGNPGAWTTKSEVLNPYYQQNGAEPARQARVDREVFCPLGSQVQYSNEFSA